MTGRLRRLEFQLLLTIGVMAGSLAVALLLASTASAGTVTNERPMLFSFGGADSSIGRLTGVLSIAADEATGDVYAINAVGDEGGPTGYGAQAGELDDERVVCKFNEVGEAQDFTAGESAGRSCLDGRETPGGAFGVEGFFVSGSTVADIAVDNSGGAGGEQGRLYVSEEGGPVHAFRPDGTYLWTLSLPVTESTCGIAVDREGHLWVGSGARQEVVEFAATGSPPAQIKSIPITNSTKQACRLAVDRSGKNLFVGLSPGLPSGLDKYVEGKYDSSSTTGYRPDVTIDQSKEDGHFFDAGGTAFAEHESCKLPHCFGSETAGSPFGGDLIGSAGGIAYNPTEDRVYVSDRASSSVKVFGPVTSGTVPDVDCQTSEPVTLHSITAHCTINPLGLPNTYHFEWKEGTGANWGAAESSATQSIEPTDGNSHAVSLTITEYKGKQLRSNTTFQVRLVGTNAANDLSAYSNADSPSTPVPPSAEVTECTTSAITTGSAHLACTIDPKEEEVEWRILARPVSGGTPAECEALAEGEFNSVASGTIPPDEPGLVEVGEDLTELEPAQLYCVRASAVNTGGGGQKDLSFRTLAVAPSEAGAAFAAPRTDTSARINARVNPHGEDLKYRFEWSEDGSNWSVLPIRESTIPAREPIVVADQMSGLEPGATYHYRLGLAENQAGSVASLGEERTFRTRTGAEVEAASPASCPNEEVRAEQHAAYLGSCRGIELVSEPDKGNQSANANGPGINDYTSSPISSDGEKVLWSVAAGAPGASTGTEASFLASRSASGWSSASVVPPAAEQVGGGEFAYLLNAASPGFGSFLFSVRYPTKLSRPALGSAVRIRSGVQDVLKSYTVQAPNVIAEESVDMSDDGAHVLALDPETKQLEDIGSARVGPPEVKGEVVSIMPGGSPSGCGLDVAEGRSFPGLLGSGIGHPGDHWIATDDASRVYFRTRADGACGGPFGLYVRNREAGKTTLVDPAGPEFITASPDGHRAYFATRSSLDPADGDPGSADLYLWDEDAGKGGESSCLTCLVKGPGGIEASAHLAELGGGLSSVLVSADLSRVYFYSAERLVAGAGKQGALNLYTLSGGQVRFVAVTQEDVLRRGSGTELSRDGGVLLFPSQASSVLGADALAAQCISPAQGEPPGSCDELYRYEVEGESLECVSCRRDGVTTHSFGSAKISITPNLRLSGDGAVAAFPTKEALVPADVNNDTDLYEWRAGTVHLLTDGVSDFQEGTSVPWVWALDGDGSNILFGLVPPGGSLTGFERDGVLNLYDARVGGGFQPPGGREICAGDSCQGPLAPAPASPAPSSATNNGRGNVKAVKPCRKGKVRRHGRCVARHDKKHKSRSHGSHGKGRRAR
jgi:hypothetical protein